MLGDDGETPIARVDGHDEYEWLGRAFVVHRIDVEMSGARVQGLEIIGPTSRTRVLFATVHATTMEASRRRPPTWMTMVYGPSGADAAEATSRSLGTKYRSGGLGAHNGRRRELATLDAPHADTRASVRITMDCCCSDREPYPAALRAQRPDATRGASRQGARRHPSLAHRLRPSERRVATPREWFLLPAR